MPAPTIAVGDEPMEAAVDAHANRVYVTNHASKTVSVVDGATNAVVTEVRVGKTPVSVAVDAVAGRVRVVNQADNRPPVIDTATNAEVANTRPSQ